MDKNGHSPFLSTLCSFLLLDFSIAESAQEVIACSFAGAGVGGSKRPKKRPQLFDQKSLIDKKELFEGRMFF